MSRKPQGSKVVVAGGLDEARAYVPPSTLPPQPRHKTLEAIKVRIAPEADPRKAPTQRRLPAPAVHTPSPTAPARGLATGGPGADGVGAEETLGGGALENAPSSRPPPGVAVPDAAPASGPRRGIAVAVLLGLLVAIGALVALRGPARPTVPAAAAPPPPSAAPVAVAAPTAVPGPTAAPAPAAAEPTAAAASPSAAPAAAAPPPSPARTAEPAPKPSAAPAEPRRPELYE